MMDNTGWNGRVFMASRFVEEGSVHDQQGKEWMNG